MGCLEGNICNMTPPGTSTAPVLRGTNRRDAKKPARWGKLVTEFRRISQAMARATTPIPADGAVDSRKSPPSKD
jgi:hypothetical protein